MYFLSRFLLHVQCRLCPWIHRSLQLRGATTKQHASATTKQHAGATTKQHAGATTKQHAGATTKQPSWSGLQSPKWPPICPLSDLSSCPFGLHDLQVDISCWDATSDRCGQAAQTAKSTVVSQQSEESSKQSSAASAIHGEAYNVCCTCPCGQVCCWEVDSPQTATPMPERPLWEML